MKLPRVSGFDVVKVLAQLGYSINRWRGSHIILQNEKGAIISVPNHKELDKGTLRALIRAAGMEVEDFVRRLK
jgi:predicted RNA binding protein YcfA (HicA-like mRNA interferase family)